MSESDCVCTAATGCPESENACPRCAHLDIYDPCPRLGFGCAGQNWRRCECCTLEQWLAAAEISPR